MEAHLKFLVSDNHTDRGSLQLIETADRHGYLGFITKIQKLI
jgi:hypothetical protein